MKICSSKGFYQKGTVLDLTKKVDIEPNKLRRHCNTKVKK